MLFLIRGKPCLSVARYSGNAAVAEHVMLCLWLGDDLGRVKLAQHVRRPHAMCSAFADGRTVNAHEVDS